MSANPQVTIEEHGRCGLVHYREGEQEILFDWEFCAGDCVAEIWPRSLEKLQETARSADQLLSILIFVGSEVVGRKAKTCCFQIDARTGRIAIVKHEPNQPPAPTSGLAPGRGSF